MQKKKKRKRWRTISDQHHMFCCFNCFSKFSSLNEWFNLCKYQPQRPRRKSYWRRLRMNERPKKRLSKKLNWCLIKAIKLCNLNKQTYCVADKSQSLLLCCPFFNFSISESVILQRREQSRKLMWNELLSASAYNI